ncbi:Scarecrow-like protein 8 [Apostasia shenzhenica]|uniref:Scarecrow-like protein 8 n=1 Tax=Apostasia shenzhenica TaxID=1088818 RepID=A0A2I0AY12_9ASPA|nr:Scarecrow-like protein 8 [Apostasia shenzhenica]
MASSFPGSDLPRAVGYGVGSAVQLPYQQRSDDAGTVAGAGGILKRSLTELERQQQMQNAIFLRSVKQRNHLSSPISPLSLVDLSCLSPAAVSLRGLDFSVWPSPAEASAAQAESEKKLSMTNQLLELERQLLDDDEDELSVYGSVLTNSEWSKTMQALASAVPAALPTPATNQSSLSPSPTTSSSSSSSSRASCSPSPSVSSRLMLQDTAAAISEGNLDAAVANLAVLKLAANPLGDPEQRLAAMMVAALVSRINSRALGSSAMIADVCSAEHQAAAHMLYEASPCFKLTLMAANLAILEATKDSPKVHILDFDLGQGRQMASLIHAIAERHRKLSPSRPPPAVKITAVCDPSFPFNSSAAGDSKLVGDRLGKLADRLGLALLFSSVTLRTTELSRETLGCELGESLAVNFAFVLSRVADESVSPANPRDELLRRVKALRPAVVALAEQDMNGNTAPFAARFSEACAHYGALLESLDATAGRDSVDRARVEACLARKAANSVASEGSDRVERCEVYGKWRARFGMAGFHPVPIGPAAAEPVKARFSSIGNNPGFTIKEEAGWLGCGWMGRVLIVASTWR